MNRSTLFLLTAPLLTLGCEDTLSADPFVSDADFLDALPRAEDQTMRVAETGESQRGLPPPPEVDEDWPDLLAMSSDVATELNDLTLSCLVLVDAVAESPPSYRSASRRSWGPLEVENDWTLAVDVVREQGDYTWDFRAARFADGALPSLCGGTHEPGSGSLANGRGTFDVWLDSWNDVNDTVGTFSTTYDLTDGQELRIDIQGFGTGGGRVEDGSYYFRDRVNRSGDFQYRTTFLLDIGEEAILEVRTRWTSEGYGRSDARVLSDDLPRVYRYSECFERNRKVWRWTDWGDGFEQGAESLCAFESPAAVDEI